MDNLQKGIITLIKSAIIGEGLPLPEDFDIEAARPQIKRHQISALAYEGAVLCGISKKLPTMQKLFRVNYSNLLRSEAQLKAVKRLTDAFEAEGIDYMLMKGCNMKQRYPEPQLRQMGDADILIRDSQYSVVKAIVEKQGYSPSADADHTYNWVSDALVLELHKRIVSRESEYFGYYGDGWAKVNLLSGHRYAFSLEDEYIYIFCHFAKHYKHGGIGLRQAVDVWVLRRALPQLDYKYISTELKKLNLEKFHENTLKTLKFWFEDGEGDTVTDIITETIFKSGSWGTKESVMISSYERLKTEEESFKDTKRRRTLRLFFLPIRILERTYPVLVKHPWLLPVFWVVRWVDVLIHRPKNLKKRINDVSIVNESKLSEFETALRMVGLK